MEMYTWTGDSVKVLISYAELSKSGVDPYNGVVDDHDAHLFFTSLLQTISRHYNMKPTMQLDAEISESETDDVLSLVIRFFDEDGNKLTLRPPNQKGLLYRFSKKEDLFALADLADRHDFQGGTLVKWAPFYYLQFAEQDSDNGLLLALLGEYGEKAYINAGLVLKKGSVLVGNEALASLKARQL
ncbi:hypothetical protein [Bacillus piscicola]|uniref:hypothetical protein n=1 Tax=Bacillus piscicola TaxID=1632684 RepID=UPI001F094C3F|nr:hypothetical protein [Bacillus piscicola]